MKICIAGKFIFGEEQKYLIGRMGFFFKEKNEWPCFKNILSPILITIYKSHTHSVFIHACIAVLSLHGCCSERNVKIPDN